MTYPVFYKKEAQWCVRQIKEGKRILASIETNKIMDKEYKTYWKNYFEKRVRSYEDKLNNIIC